MMKKAGQRNNGYEQEMRSDIWIVQVWWQSRMSGGLLVHKEIIDPNIKYISRTCIHKLKYAHSTVKKPPKGAPLNISLFLIYLQYFISFCIVCIYMS